MTIILIAVILILGAATARYADKLKGARLDRDGALEALGDVAMKLANSKAECEKYKAKAEEFEKVSGQLSVLASTAAELRATNAKLVGDAIRLGRELTEERESKSKPTSSLDEPGYMFLSSHMKASHRAPPYPPPAVVAATEAHESAPSNKPRKATRSGRGKRDV